MVFCAEVTAMFESVACIWQTVSFLTCKNVLLSWQTSHYAIIQMWPTFHLSLVIDYSSLFPDFASLFHYSLSALFILYWDCGSGVGSWLKASSFKFGFSCSLIKKTKRNDNREEQIYRTEERLKNCAALRQQQVFLSCLGWSMSSKQHGKAETGEMSSGVCTADWLTAPVSCLHIGLN